MIGNRRQQRNYRNGIALLCSCLQLFLALPALAQTQVAERIVPPTEQAHDLSTPEATVDNDLAIAPNYVLGQGDQLAITDYSGKDGAYNTQKATVMVDGKVSIYPIGVVFAAGKTVQQLTDLVNERAKKYIYEPKFLVSLSRPRPLNVYVLGEVLNPGMYTLGGKAAPTPSYNEPPPYQGLEVPKENVNIITSVDNGEAAVGLGPESTTVLNALQRAGGLRDTANVRTIRVTKARTRDVIHVDLWKMLVEGDYTQDIPLQPHDVVFVPPGGQNHYDPRALGRLAANQTRSVRVWGSVKAPGLYQLGPGEDVLSIIARAGGFTGNAIKSSVMLSRANQDGTVTKIRVPVAAALTHPGSVGRTLVQPGDVVIVSTNPALVVGKPLLTGGIAAGAAILFILIANRITSVNAKTGPGVATNTTTRQIVF